MKISINGKPADIVLENEKTVGDLLTGLEQWLDGTGNRLSGLIIDGEGIGAAHIPGTMEQNLEGISALDIRVSTWDELALEALLGLKTWCELFAAAPFDERAALRESWQKSPDKNFLSSDMQDIYHIACLCFEGDGLTPENLKLIVDERFRELADPGTEILAEENAVNEITARMEDFPLDMQTGKDARASETLRLFTRTGDKLMRLLQILMRRGFSPEEYLNSADGNLLKDFAPVLVELISAYKNQDTVLAGDLTEYELAPRVKKLYTVLSDYIRKEADR